MSDIELDNFDDYRNYIKGIILSQEDLWKLIYHADSLALDDDYGENPYIILEESNEHGFVLFKEKESEILDSAVPIILIIFNSHRNDNFYSVQDIEIQIKIIFKGEIIELSDETNRSHRIAELFDKNLNGIAIDNGSKIRRESFEILSVNEQNYGYQLTFTTTSTSFTDEIQVYKYQEMDDEYGISRQSYSLILTDNPVLVSIQEPQTDYKTEALHGYDLSVEFTMVYNIIPEIINESSLIKYKDNFYRINKILEYSGYWVCDLIITYTAIINE